MRANSWSQRPAIFIRVHPCPSVVKNIPGQNLTMLTTLRIKNLALVPDLTLELQPGCNVITGETGAGKSIIIGALNLVLGERADRSLIRTGSDSCSVEAVFDVSRLAAAQIPRSRQRQSAQTSLAESQRADVRGYGPGKRFALTVGSFFGGKRPGAVRGESARPQTHLHRRWHEPPVRQRLGHHPERPGGDWRMARGHARPARPSVAAASREAARHSRCVRQFGKGADGVWRIGSTPCRARRRKIRARRG